MSAPTAGNSKATRGPVAAVPLESLCALVNGSEELTWLENGAGRCFAVSRSLALRLGYGAADLVGQPVEQWRPAESVGPLQVARRSALDGRSACCRAAWNLGARRCELEFDASPLWGANGAVEGVLWRANEGNAPGRIADDQRRTERLASMGALAAGIAHELNNPLGAIMLEAETAALASRGGDYDPLLASALEGIRQNVDRCARIVKGVLRFARHEHLTHAPCDLAGVLRRARDYTRELAAQRSVRLEFAGLSEPLALLGNEMALEQVFVNLFNNALEASPPGSLVEVRAHADPSVVRISVSDQGSGIPAAELERVFEPFFTTRQHAAGTGLGLSIVQGIVTDHGGSVKVHSQRGQGAVFTVSLPRTKGP